MSLTDQTTQPGTVADYWINRVGIGSWKTADRVWCCMNLQCARCAIPPGDRYLDTGELRHGEFDTTKVCKLHAAVEVR